MTMTLGRQPAFDERSRAFGILAVEDRVPRSYTWAPQTLVLDQGAVPACVGFSWAGELGARPVVIPTTNNDGLVLYGAAQAIDRAEGRHWDEGASVLAGAKAVQAAGKMEAYRWAFGVEQLATAVSWAGPCIIGIPWHEAMFTPGADGYITLGGGVVGGHAIVVHGYSIRYRRFTLRNTWGPGWGRNGGCYVSYEDMATLLADSGDACVPVGRKLG